MMNEHAKNESDLASLVAQETLEDLFGGRVRTYNGPGLLVGLVVVLCLVVLFAALVLALMPETLSAAAPATLYLPLVVGPQPQIAIDCMNGGGQLIPCPVVVP